MQTTHTHTRNPASWCVVVRDILGNWSKPDVTNDDTLPLRSRPSWVPAGFLRRDDPGQTVTAFSALSPAKVAQLAPFFLFPSFAKRSLVRKWRSHPPKRANAQRQLGVQEFQIGMFCRSIQFRNQGGGVGWHGERSWNNKFMSLLFSAPPEIRNDPLCHIGRGPMNKPGIRCEYRVYPRFSGLES